MVLEQLLSSSGVAERIVGRRRRSLAARIESQLEAKRGKKAEKNEVIEVEESEEDAAEKKEKEEDKISGKKRVAGPDAETEEPDDKGMEDEVWVEESQEIVEERRRIEEELNLKRQVVKKRKDGDEMSTEEVIQMGFSAGLLSIAQENSIAIREAITEAIDDARIAGIQLEKEDEELARMGIEDDGKFSWAKDGSDEDWYDSDDEAGDDLAYEEFPL